ncbi:MAG: thioredoxin [Gaiellaceae bacterium]
MDVTDATFATDVLSSELPVIVDFWAPWCRPCKTVGRVLDELVSEQPDRVLLAKVNVDENLAVSSRYSVLSLPTVILFVGGEPRETVVGPRPRQHFERVFEPHLAA